MTKNEMFDAFDGVLTNANMVPESSGDYILHGKFCIIAPIGNDLWDVWVCNAKDLRKGLGERKVTNILDVFGSAYQEGTLIRLTGEAHGIVAGTEKILGNSKLLGLKRKRQLSPESLEKARARMITLRKSPMKAAA